MDIKALIHDSLDSLLKHFDYRMVANQNLYEWQKTPSHTHPRYRMTKLPEDAANYLVMNNPRLKELQTRYAAFDGDVTTPLLWTDTNA